MATLLDIVGYKQVHGCIASSAIYGRLRMLRILMRSAFSVDNSVITGVDFPVAVSAKWVKGMLAKVGDGQYITSHSRYTDHLMALIKHSGNKVLQIIRDPRAIALSHVYYVSKEKEHPLNDYYNRVLKTFDERLEFSVTGGFAGGGLYLESLGERSRGIHGWVCCGDVLTVKFEDLVGEQGGGTRGRQYTAICNVLEFIGLEGEDSLIRRCQDELFGDRGRTFRSGRVDEWRQAFSSKQLQLCDELAGDMIDVWGYR